MGPPVYGMQRKATRKERLRWDVYFVAPLAASDRAELVAGLEHIEGSWALDRVLTLTWDGASKKVSTALFRDQVASRLAAWNAMAPIAGAHFCLDGPWRESRARSRESAGLPAYLFPFLNHGVRPPRHLWRVSLLMISEAPVAVVPSWLRKVGFVPLKAGAWMRLQHRHGLDPIPRAFAEIIDQLDAALEELHERQPIALAVFGPDKIAASADDWHAWSVEQAKAITWTLPNDAELEPLFASAPLEPAVLAALMEEARASYEHAEDQGDPSSALEGVLDVLERLPSAHAVERRQVQAWADELAAIVAG